MVTVVFEVSVVSTKTNLVYPHTTCNIALWQDIYLALAQRN